MDVIVVKYSNYSSEIQLCFWYLGIKKVQV